MPERKSTSQDGVECYEDGSGLGHGFLCEAPSGGEGTLTEIGEGIAVPRGNGDSEGKPPPSGDLLVRVVDICTNDGIPNASVAVRGDKRTTNTEGNVEYKDLSVGDVNIEARAQWARSSYPLGELRS